jgi:hypothetical protein
VTKGARDRLGRSVLLASALASAAASAVAAMSCITAPPPDLPVLVDYRPTIQSDAVQPPQGPLYSLPDVFLVPVQTDVPELFQFRVFIDFDPSVGPDDGLQYVGSQASAPDGGATLVSVPTSALEVPGSKLDTPICPHRIEFIVAYGFNGGSQHTPNNYGGDLVTWWYFPGGAAGECPDYDAGDGAFPDVGLDGLPVVPESGGEP